LTFFRSAAQVLPVALRALPNAKASDHPAKGISI